MKFFPDSIFKLKNAQKKSIFRKIKIFLGILLLILLLILLIAIYAFDITLFNKEVSWKSYSKEALSKIMEQALRQPSTTRYENLLQDPITKTAYAYHVKDDWLDLEPITKEEWMNVKCNSHYKGDLEDRRGFTEDFITHTTCIQPLSLAGRYPNKNAHSIRIFRTSENRIIADEIVPNKFVSPCIRVDFNEYILNYPKILNNIIKIAEKPCYYLKNEALRSALYCDESRKAWYEEEKSCVVIDIFDSEGYKKMQLRIPRQDNKHLLKGQKEWDDWLSARKKLLESYNKK